MVKPPTGTSLDGENGGGQYQFTVGHAAIRDWQRNKSGLTTFGNVYVTIWGGNKDPYLQGNREMSDLRTEVQSDILGQFSKEN